MRLEMLEGPLELLEDDPDIFDLFVRWLYYKHTGGDNALHLIEPCSVKTLLDIALSADKRAILELREDIIKFIAYCHLPVQTQSPIVQKVWIQAEQLIRIFKNTEKGSGLRKLFIQLWVWHIHPGNFKVAGN